MRTCLSHSLTNVDMNMKVSDDAQTRPRDTDSIILPNDVNVEYEYDCDDGASDSDNTAQELCVPNQNPKVQQPSLAEHVVEHPMFLSNLRRGVSPRMEILLSLDLPRKF